MEIFVALVGIVLALVASTFSGVQGKAQDTERKTDIKAMHGQVEAFYAQDGRYPSLANINDSAWRSTNMKGLDKEALKDPDGSDYMLKPLPDKNAYSYSAKASDNGDCNNTTKDCTTYVLTATLGDGSTFTKTALN